MIIMNVGLVINLSGNDNVIGHKLAQWRSHMTRREILGKKYEKVTSLVKKLENVKIFEK